MMLLTLCKSTNESHPGWSSPVKKVVETIKIYTAPAATPLAPTTPSRKLSSSACEHQK